MAKESKRRCPDCEIDISGLSFSSKGDGRCIECKGTGRDRHSEALVQAGTLGLEGDYYPCKTCAGTGQCQTCGGTGYEYYDEDNDNNDSTNMSSENYESPHHYNSEDGFERLRLKDARIRAALERGEKESLYSYMLSHPGTTIGCAGWAIWPAGVWGAAIGGVIALIFYLIFGADVQVLIPIGFIIAWGRSFWSYVSSAWFAALRIGEKD